MLNSTQTKVKNTALSLGYELTPYKIEDIAYKVDSSDSVSHYSQELSVDKVCKDLRFFVITSATVFLISAGVPMMVQKYSPEILSSTSIEVTTEEHISNGTRNFRITFTILFVIELIWVIFNLYKENKATQKMILYFLQRRVNVRK